MRTTSPLALILLFVPPAAAAIACGAGPMETPQTAASASASPPASGDGTTGAASSSASTGAVASAPSAAALPPPLPAPPPPPEAKVTLISPGDEPRKALRYAFHAGAKESATMDMRMALSLAVDGDKRAMPTAPVSISVSLVEEKVLPSGNLDYAFTLDTIDIAKDADPSFAPYKTVLAALQGTKGEMEVTPQGRTEKVTITPPAGASDQIAEITEQLVGALRDMMVPLPDEPVGKGAQWKVTGPFPVKPVVAARTTTCTLTSLAGTKGTVEAVEEVGGSPQTITTPGGQRADLQAMKGAGTRKASFDLTRLVPASTWSLTAYSTQTLFQGGAAHQVQAHSEITLTVAPKK